MKLILRSAHLVLVAALALGAPVLHAQQRPAAAKPHLTVYKSPTCGCCAKWVDYMNANGFTSEVTNMVDVTPIKIKHNVSPRLASCHTTLVGGYVIEGHVPVEDVRRLLKEKPAVVGLAAPGMPAGSPGMDVPNSPPYDVVSFDKAGTTRVYASHKPK
jgi:hypothetical protein